MTKKKLFLFLFLFSFFLYNCTEKTEPNLLTTSINTTNVGDTNTPDAGDTNPSSTPVKRVLPHITNERVVTAVDTNTVPLGEGMFYLQLTHALDNQSSDETTYANAIALIRAALRAGNGQIEIETTRAKQDITQGSNLLQTIPYSKTTYRLLKNGVRTLLIDYPYSRGKTISHVGLAMDFFDEYYLQSITFKRGIADHVHYSSLNVINTLTAYTSIPLAIQNGINGNIRLGYQGNFSMWGAIQAGRLAIIAGDVREQVAISDEQIQSLPVIFSNYSISIQFYSEDWTDFDYNDSFVRVELTRQISSNASLNLIPNQSFTVKEDVQSNTVLGYIYSFHQNPLSTYAIIDGDDNRRFSILFDGTNALLHTVGEIDYEQQPHYQLAVEVTDTLGNISTGVVFVNVQKVKLTNIDGFTFVEDNNYPMIFYDNGQVSNGILITNTTINGVSYYGDGNVEFSRTVFYSNEQIAVATLANGLNTNGVSYFGYIGYYANGKVGDGFLRSNQSIGGLSYSDIGAVSFYENGHIRFGVFAENQTISGIGYKAGVDPYGGEDSLFHENGQLFQAVLLTNTTINGRTYLGGTSITYHANGNVGIGTLAANTLDFGTLAANQEVTFYSNGKVRSGYLNEEVTLTLSSSGESVVFSGYFDRYDSSTSPVGSIKQIVLAQAGRLFGTNYLAGQVLRFIGTSGYRETGGTTTHTYTNGESLSLTNFGNYYELFPYNEIDSYYIYQETVFSQFPSRGAGPVD